MPPLIVDLLYVPLAVLYLPVLLYQMIVLKKNRRGWRQRLGFIRPRVGNKPCIWVHGVSLGEVNATRSLVAEIHKRLPAYDVAISATTDTGYAAAVKEYAPKLVFRYPLDFSFVVRRALRRIRPDAIVLMELEAWPNFVALARRAGIPIGVANGRVTEKGSMRWFRLPVIRAIARSMFAELSWIASQNESYAARFAELGAPSERIVVTGTMKYDTAMIADRVPNSDRLAEALEIEVKRPLIVAGSTGPGEEEMLLRAYERLVAERPDVQLAIIPRHPERFDEVARLIESRKFVCVRRSRHPDLLGQEAREAQRRRSVEMVKRRSGSKTASGPAAVILGDTMGELRKFYSLAAVVFVGRTLAPLGGSDLMEVAGLGKAMCFGPHVENFADVAEKLLAAEGAMKMKDESELPATLRRILDDPASASRIGHRAQDVVRQNTGATSRTVDLLCECLGRRADHPEASISTVRIPANPC